MFFPVLIIVMGIVWLLNSLNLISTNVWSIILPVAVILAGISMISNRKCMWCGWHHHHHNHNDQGNNSQPDKF